MTPKKNNDQKIKSKLTQEKNKICFIDSLKEMLSKEKRDSISIGKVLSHLKDEGLIFLIIVISLPTSLPIPTPPGFTTLFGVPLCLLTVQMVYRLESPWLPKWIAKKEIKISTFNSFILKAEPLFYKLTYFIKPNRHSKLTTKSTERLVGLLSFLCSISIALPILFGNFVPSFAISVMCIGLLYKDGIIVLIGIVISIIGLFVSTAVVCLIAYLGLEAFEKIVSSVF